MALGAHALTQLATAKGIRWLNISGAGNDADVEQAIDQASALIESYLKRHLEEATYTDELYFGHGRQILQLKQFPIISVTAVKENDVILSATEYTVLKEEGQLHRIGGWGGGRYSTPGLHVEPHPSAINYNLKVTYAAGFKLPGASSGSGTDLPKDIEMACLMLVKTMYKPREAGVMSESIGTFSRTYENLAIAEMPAEIRAILDPYRRVEVYL